MSSHPKYVAAGFMQDANRLFTDFDKKPSKDFETFAELWKKHLFVYIFMGRPEEKEYRDFVNEMYQLLLTYVSTSSFVSQIGAVYLLYALYRNQEILPNIKIRVNQNQYKVLKQIHYNAFEQKLRSLHYIMDYLTDHAFEFVFNGSLFGPCSSKNSRRYSTPQIHEFGFQSDLKHDLQFFHESNILKDLKSLHLQYLKKREIVLPNTSNAKTIADTVKKYDEFDLTIDCLIRNRQTNKEVGRSDGIGSRRTMLKNASFERKAAFRYLNSDDETYPQESKTLIKKHIRQKRLPAHKRRVGRPRKNKPESDDEHSSSISEKSVDTNLNIVKTSPKQKRGPIGRRKVSYLKNYTGPFPIEGPKKDKLSEELSDNSESSNDIFF